MKKFVFLIVAVIMCISFAVPSMASEYEPLSTEEMAETQVAEEQADAEEIAEAPVAEESEDPALEIQDNESPTDFADNGNPSGGRFPIDVNKEREYEIIFEDVEDTRYIISIDDNGKTSVNVTLKAPAGASYNVSTNIKGVRGPLGATINPEDYTIFLTEGVEYTTQSTANGIRITIDTSKIEKDGRAIHLQLTVAMNDLMEMQFPLAQNVLMFVLKKNNDDFGEVISSTYPDGFNYVDGKWGWYKDGSLQTSKTGIIKGSINGKESWYYVSAGVLKTGWVKYNNKYYYFNPSTGAIKTGWVKSGGKYYYLNPSTGALKTGWLKYKGSYYYLSPKTGNPVTGKQKIGGNTYTFNAKGVCVG